MSALEEIKFWYTYNSHVRKRYLRAILSLPKGEALKDRGASHPSIFDIFVHVLDSYRFFFLGIIDRRPEVEYAPLIGKVKLEDLQEHEKQVDKVIMAKISSLTPVDLTKIVLDEFDLKSVLNHMVEEELQHRGETNALFWQMDIDPPISDIEDAKYIKNHLEGKTCELCNQS
ncbi:MAG: DinB family protein [Nitrososphaerales archaeon]